MKLLSKSTLAAGALLLAASLTTNLSAVPLPAPFDSLGADFLTVSVGAKLDYNSNVLSSPGGATKFDDFIFTVNPMVKLEYGAASDNDISLSFMEDFLRYYRHSALNNELSTVDLNYKRKQGTMNLSADASYTQGYNNTPSAVTPTLSSIIRFDTINAGGNLLWNYSESFNFTVGAQFSQTHYLYTVGQTFQDNDNYTIPATAFYVYSKNLSLGLGYTYSQTDVKNSTAPFSPGRDRDSNAVTFNVNLDEFQNLSGTANVGVTENRIDAAPGTPALTSTTVSYGMALKYNYSSNLVFSLDGRRGFSTGTQGQNIETTGVALGATFAYSSELQIVANILNYTYSQYLQNVPSRTDNTYTTGITVNWTPPWTWLTLSAGYTYFMNSSDAPGATYNINVLTVSATVKY